MSKLLFETSPSTLTSKDGLWHATFLTSGKGSSGSYSDELLREYGPAALPAGSKCFITHNRRENGEPDPRDMWGFIPDGARYEESGKLVGEIQVFPHYKELVETLAQHTNLSIYVMGETDGNGNVTELIPAIDNGVDLVVHGGRPGSELVEKLYESARMASAVIADGETSLGQPGGTGAASASTTTHNESEIDNMDELTKLVESLIGKIDSLAVEVATVKSLSENAAAAAGEKLDAIQVADEISKAVTEAKLPEGARKRVIEAVSAGTAVAEAVKTESEYIKNIVESIDIKPERAVAGIGRVVEGQSEQFSFKKIAEVTR